MKNLNTFVQLPVWVCQSCRRTTDGGMNRKMDLVSLVRSNDNSNIIVTWSWVSIAQYLILSGWSPQAVQITKVQTEGLWPVS